MSDKSRITLALPPEEMRPELSAVDRRLTTLTAVYSTGWFSR